MMIRDMSRSLLMRRALERSSSSVRSPESSMYIGSAWSLFAADVSAVTAHSDWPAMNVHAHLGPLRALLGLLGVRPTAAGLDVVPRVPTATYAVHMPRLSIDSAPDRMRVRYTPLADDAITLRVAVPFGTSPIPSVTIDGVAVTPTLDAGLVVVPATVRAGTAVDVVITPG